MNMDFILTGQRIREARKYRRLTAETLAERVGLATESLRHIENAASKPSLQTLFKIATELNVSLDYLTGRTPDISSALTSDFGKDFGLNKTQQHMLQDIIKGMLPIITKHL